MAKIVRKCRKCGQPFEQTARPHLYKVSASSSPYVMRSYCPPCTSLISRAARLCDPRYVGVGGHGDVLEYRTVRGEA